MSAMTLEELSEKMRKLDFCMLSTTNSTRPMSNNGDVDYDGDSWFFSYEDTRKVKAIAANPTVSLSFTAPPSMLGKPGIFIAIEGQAAIIKEKAEFEDHWVKELNIWFPEGVDTPGLVLLMVRASRIEYWDGEENEQISLK